MSYKSVRFLRKLINKKSLLITLTLLLAFLPPLAQYTLGSANAAFTNAKIQINNSKAGATGVTYQHRMTASASTDIKQITILFCTTASGACSTPAGFFSTSATRVSDNISGTGRTDNVAVNGTVTSVITTPASQTPLGLEFDITGITNSTTPDTTFYARITTYSDTGSTVIDTSTVAFAILTSTSISVSASVDPNLTFSVAGVASSGTVNSATTTVTSTATTIPYSTLTVATPAIAAHDLTVTTNAGSGYTITASASATPPLVSGSNNIDPFTGTNASPATWSSPNGSTANTNTGFFGYTTEDTTLCAGTANRFNSNKWAGTSTLGGEVVCSAAGVSAETTRVGWEIEANAIQPAGTYTGSVILIATPTY